MAHVLGVFGADVIGLFLVLVFPLHDDSLFGVAIFLMLLDWIMGEIVNR